MAENTAGPPDTLMEDRYMVGGLSQSAKFTMLCRMSTNECKKHLSVGTVVDQVIWVSLLPPSKAHLDYIELL